ncbi:GNAT family N-acetyltransferase [Ramlibacter sp. PS4R-6]|uniref:GNAT family N-acetyltransferase n=1 Tax=Ramlibacter sp. PS4R-6 TaxID=3133438 RepID=UPI0030ACACC0
MDRYELVTAPESFLALRAPWDALCARSPGHFLGQTFAWARLCWDTVARPRGRGLACVAAWHDGRLVLVWPLATLRDGAGAAIARPLDSETSEYADVLVEDGPLARQRVAAAVRLIAQSCLCDRLELPNVRSAALLGQLLATQPSPVRSIAMGSLAAVSVRWQGIASWDDYAASLDSHERRELGRKKRRFEEAGPVRLDILRDPLEATAAIDWSLAQKLAWLEDTGRENEWIAPPGHREFLAASLSAFGAKGERLVFVLRLREAIVATLLCSLDGARMEWFMCASAPEHARLSPAQLLRERVLQWAWERRMDCDFRMGDQRFKAFWGNHVEQTSTWVVAVSARGRAFVMATRVRRGLAARLSPQARARLRNVVRRWSAPALQRPAP